MRQNTGLLEAPGGFDSITVEDSTNVMELVEHDDVLPKMSVAVAYTVVVELSATDAVMLKFPVPFAVPVARTELVQVLFVYKRTVLPASAIPLKTGEVLLAGEVGDTEVNTGRAKLMPSLRRVAL